MIVFKKVTDLVNFVLTNKKNHQNIGFVPTMGALHAGHLSLIEEAGKATDLVVCSIFVNPTQFNDPKDFEKYPITIDQDIYLLEKAGCSVLFLPSVTEMYPNGINGVKKYELGFLETILDGKYRPGHFQGVCQIMDRLLQIVQPDKLFMGQKDYQQCMVLKELINNQFPSVQFTMCSTQREIDGLAMSSRNVRLKEENRKIAVKIFEILQFLKENIKEGDLTGIKIDMVKKLTDLHFKVDYVEIVLANTLKPIDNWDGKEPLVALIAAFLGEVRLIDNFII